MFLRYCLALIMMCKVNTVYHAGIVARLSSKAMRMFLDFLGVGLIFFRSAQVQVLIF
jgi:hypothetical protein